MRPLLLVVVVLTACARPAPPAAPPAPPAAVLARIETWVPPPIPDVQGMHIPDTYDARLSTGSPVPPSKTATLICDLLQRMDMDLAGSLTDRTSDASFALAIGVYTTRAWADIAGFRPWAHSTFIRGLSEAERAQLAHEAAAEHAARGESCPD
jgi:hypothetical protein